MAAQALSVQAAAQQLGCSVRTVRRQLATGRLAGSKVGRDWVVWAGTPSSTSAAPAAVPPNARGLRARLRILGSRLIAVGNALAAPAPRPGAVLLTWRRPRSLQVILAIGRLSPLHSWTPYAVGIDFPFWLAERAAWRPVLPLLRRYERLRLWCAPRLLRVPGVPVVIEAELASVDAMLDDLEALQTQRPKAHGHGKEGS
ncbi:MAG: helix-turn-helix domain-containing protein [Candidatus Tectimicrobiota bacterium]